MSLKAKVGSSGEVHLRRSNQTVGEVAVKQHRTWGFRSGPRHGARVYIHKDQTGRVRRQPLERNIVRVACAKQGDVVSSTQVQKQTINLFPVTRKLFQMGQGFCIVQTDLFEEISHVGARLAGEVGRLAGHLHAFND